jgi:hypothetical protein
VNGSGLGTGTGTPCDYCSNATWELTVVWDLGGTLVSDTFGPDQVSCVF